ncbi:sulfur carrier protein ThiS [uncultured Halopseudomonas sp.]|jgi:sulfur carrier protein|uniref:sulfur carrier protein ThiS n=1 Tax=uncultured Halopseudomonas sp. TaxID=2901193 RepID=UPI0030EE343D|tara:strand:+ start:27993 stop:28193 length:201 start_codon:yes stop_codon:yes gene_type:complete
MQIQLNGDPFVLDSATTLTDLIEQLGLTGKRLAIELNLEIVPRSEHSQTVLTEGDRIEIVHAIGGG